MYGIFIYNMYRAVPEDWNDDSKYLNKELIFETAAEDTYFTNSKGDKIYTKFKTQLYSYNMPENDMEHTITFAVCPVCGSMHVKVDEYNNLCPEELAGSAGLNFVCLNCGFRRSEPQIMS